MSKAAEMRRPDLPCKLPNDARKKLSLRFDDGDQRRSEEPPPSRDELQKCATIDRSDGGDHCHYYYEFPREEPTFLASIVENKPPPPPPPMPPVVEDEPQVAVVFASSEPGAERLSERLRGQDDSTTPDDDDDVSTRHLNYVQVSCVKRPELPPLPPLPPAATEQEVVAKERPRIPPKKPAQAESNPMSLRVTATAATDATVSTLTTTTIVEDEPGFSVNRKLIDDLDREDEDPSSNYYCQPFVLTDAQPPPDVTLDSFKAEIYKSRANRMCADCKAADRLPGQLSCLYLITLCDQCANTHFQLCHFANKGFIIEIDSLYALLSNANATSALFNYRSFQDGGGFGVADFLALFKQVGNDMANSLVEFQEEAAAKSRASQSKHAYIVDKYLGRRFINADAVGQDELNRRLMENVAGASLVMTVYYLFLGANINFAHADRTVLDAAASASQLVQANYLRLNNGLHWRELNSSMMNHEVEGHLVQVYNVHNQSSSTLVDASSRLSLWCKLKVVHAQLIQLSDDPAGRSATNSRARSAINYSSIIRIGVLEQRPNTFEVKWCHQNNNSLISTYFEAASAHSQLQTWVKQFVVKTLYEFLRSEFVPEKDALALKLEEAGERADDWFERSRAELLGLLELVEAYHVSLAGLLHLGTAEASDKVFAMLLCADEGRGPSYYRSCLVLVRSKSLLAKEGADDTLFEVLDLRKLVRLRRQEDSIQLEAVARTFTLRYNGYSQNLDAWFERLSLLAKPGFRTLEEQLVDKSGVPVLVDKCCSYVELNFMDEKAFYSAHGLSNLMLKENKSELRKLQAVLGRLERERDFELGSCELAAVQVLFVLSKFLQHAKIDAGVSSRPYRLAFRDRPLRSEGHVAAIRHVLAQQAKHAPCFYHTLGRIALHLYLISRFASRNELSCAELSAILAPFLFSTAWTTTTTSTARPDHVTERAFFAELLEIMVENYAELFNVSAEFIQVQARMIDKSIYLKNLNKSTINKFNSFSLDSSTSSSTSATAAASSESTKFLVTIFLFDKNSEQSFQANVDAKFKCKSVLEMAKREFKLDESKYWCLFEVFDHEHLSLRNFASASSVDLSAASELPENATESSVGLLERLLPVNASLLDSLSTWATFYLCVKCNHIQIDIEKSFITSTSLSTSDYNVYKAIDECEFLSYCDAAASASPNDSPVSASSHRHRYSLGGGASGNSGHSTSRKWKACNISIQNAIVRIHKRSGQAAESPTRASLIDEFKIEECIVYYGFYNIAAAITSATTTGQSGSRKSHHLHLHHHHHSGEASAGGQVGRRSLSKASIISSIARFRSSSELSARPINEEECLTLYSKVTRSAYCVRLGSKEKAQAWYYTLFKLAYFPDTWTYFQMDHLPAAAATRSAKKPQPPPQPALTPTQDEAASSEAAAPGDASTNSSKSLLNMFLKAASRKK